MWTGFVSRIRSSNRLKRLTKLRRRLLIGATTIAALGVALSSVTSAGNVSATQKDSYKEIVRETVNASQFITFASNSFGLGGKYPSPSYDQAEKWLLKAHTELTLISERFKGEDVRVNNNSFHLTLEQLDYVADTVVGLDWEDTTNRAKENIRNGRFSESYRDIERFKQRVLRLKDFVNKDSYFHKANTLEREVQIGERDLKYFHELANARNIAEHSTDIRALNDNIQFLHKEMNIVRKDKSVLRDLGEDPSKTKEQITEILGMTLAKKAEALVMRAETSQTGNDLFLAKMDATQAIRYGNEDAVKILEKINEGIKLYNSTKTVPRIP